MALTPEQWDAFRLVATIAQPTVPIPGVHGVIGRSITKGVAVVCGLWARHRKTLIPFMTQLAIAALDALLSAQVDINNVNPPGPQ
jgi:hypothetical protein